jgi:hypothetical protein
LSRISSCHFSDRLGGHTTTAVRAMAQEEFLENQAGLDGLPQADVVGE